MKSKEAAIAQAYILAGYEPQSAIAAARSNEPKILVNTGLARK